jgi:hypothetical protein
MQIHGPDDTVRQINVGEYHTGAVAIYVGPVRIVTYTAEDCDMLIAAACLAKERHDGVLRGGRPRTLVIAGDFGPERVEVVP